MPNATLHIRTGAIYNFVVQRSGMILLIDFLGLLPRATKGRKQDLFNLDRYSKLTRAVFVAKIEKTAAVCIFFDE